MSPPFPGPARRSSYRQCRLHFLLSVLKTHSLSCQKSSAPRPDPLTASHTQADVYTFLIYLDPRCLLHSYSDCRKVRSVQVTTAGFITEINTAGDQSTHCTLTFHLTKQIPLYAGKSGPVLWITLDVILKMYFRMNHISLYNYRIYNTIFLLDVLLS